MDSSLLQDGFLEDAPGVRKNDTRVETGFNR